MSRYYDIIKNTNKLLNKREYLKTLHLVNLQKSTHIKQVIVIVSMLCSNPTWYSIQKILAITSFSIFDFSKLSLKNCINSVTTKLKSSYLVWILSMPLFWVNSATNKPSKIIFNNQISSKFKCLMATFIRLF